nr:MAG TPA: hypothetical protein [Bacteriophage sp.]
MAHRHFYLCLTLYMNWDYNVTIILKSIKEPFGCSD